jgi:hypothetical protein
MPYPVHRHVNKVLEQIKISVTSKFKQHKGKQLNMPGYCYTIKECHINTSYSNHLQGCHATRHENREYSLSNF